MSRKGFIIPIGGICARYEALLSRLDQDLPFTIDTLRHLRVFLWDILDPHHPDFEILRSDIYFDFEGYDVSHEAVDSLYITMVEYLTRRIKEITNERICDLDPYWTLHDNNENLILRQRH